MTLLIFKTNVQCRADVELLQPYLDLQVGCSCWHFDLEDCDKILRVEIKSELLLGIVPLLKSQGFYCEELED